MLNTNTDIYINTSNTNNESDYTINTTDTTTSIDNKDLFIMITIMII